MVDDKLIFLASFSIFNFYLFQCCFWISRCHTTYVGHQYWRMFTCLDGTCSRCQMCTVWWASSSFRSLRLHGNSFILEFFGLGKPKIDPNLKILVWVWSDQYQDRLFCVYNSENLKFWIGLEAKNQEINFIFIFQVKVWNPETEECLHTLSGHTNRVYSLQFDGIHVVSGSLDTSIRVWDVETGNF